ncbi:MAG: hypothetical protein LPH21_04950 [Shewanella sp.]|nr:hypothetical protein [Shewanella sp.]MCF1456919.1 hypothetical protein [Shewanella sp.]
MYQPSAISHQPSAISHQQSETLYDKRVGCTPVKNGGGEGSSSELVTATSSWSRGLWLIHGLFKQHGGVFLRC